MAASNDTITWRKLPIGLIRDEDMDYISDRLPPHLKAAPYMFYMTALCKADNDGIFDLEDGIIFARLMRIGTPEDVFTIANLMMKRHIIQRFGLTTLCILTVWDYPKLDKPRTMEDRRRIVQKQIEDKSQAETVEFTIQDEAPEEDTINIEFGKNPVSDPNFSCFLNDKNAKNVTKNFYDDKNEKNVVKKNQTEREIERDIKRDTKETHTQETKIETEKQGLQADFRAFRPCTEEKAKETQTIQAEEETELHGEISDLAEEALTAGKGVKVGENSTQLHSALEGFFAKNCLGFNADVYRGEINELELRIMALADDHNPAEIIASVFCSQFKLLTEEDGYYKGAPLTPETLLKPGVYGHVLANASKILLTDKTKSSEWLRQVEKDNREAQEQKAIYDGFTDQYLKYGIDPNDPQRAVKLMHAQRETADKDDEPP